MKPFEITIFFITLISFASVVQSEEIKTNLEIFQKLYAEAFQQVEFSASDSINGIALINLKPAESNAWLVEDALINTLDKKGVHNLYSRAQNEQSDTTQVWNIYYRPVRNSVTYQRHKNHLLRKISIAVFYKGQTAGNRVLFSKNIEKSYADTLQLKELKYIEDESIPVTVGEKPAGLWEKIVEPALISVVTAAVIVIFYSYRSK